MEVNNANSAFDYNKRVAEFKEKAAGEALWIAEELERANEQIRIERELSQRRYESLRHLESEGPMLDAIEARKGEPIASLADVMEVDSHYRELANPVGRLEHGQGAQGQMSAREWLFANGWAENEGCWWHAKSDPFGAEEIDLPTVLEAFARSQGEEKNG